MTLTSSTVTTSVTNSGNGGFAYFTGDRVVLNANTFTANSCEAKSSGGSTSGNGGIFYFSHSGGTASTLTFINAFNVGTAKAAQNGGMIYATGSASYTTSISNLAATSLTATSGSGGGLYFINSGTISITV